MLLTSLPAFACHVAARLHYEKAPSEERAERAKELAAEWLNLDAHMDHTQIDYVLKSAVTCDSGTADGFPCHNVDLVAHMPLASIGGGNGNDMWGWKDELTGKEYALVGRSNGTAFVDVSDPKSPVYLGNLPTHASNSPWRDIKVYGNHAFIVADFADNHGMQVFDLTQLRTATPGTNFTETAHYPGFQRAHNIVINEETGFAYAVGSEVCSGGLHMIDVRTPATPTFAGCYDGDSYTHDAQCVIYTGPDLDHQGAELCFASNEDTLTIVDVTDKANPALVSRTGYAGSGYTHQGWLSDDQRRFFLDDEGDESIFNHNTRTYVWNLDNLDAPSVERTYDSPFPSTDHNLYAVGDFVFQANYSIGLRILDGAQTGNLSEVAFFDTHPESNSSGGGAWSVYPFFENGVVAISDINRGLFLLRPNLPDIAIFGNGFENGGTGDWDDTIGLPPAPAGAATAAPAAKAEAGADKAQAEAPVGDIASVENAPLVGADSH